ncbi:putative protein phosphatase 2C like protein C10F6.17c [Glarea lozoyensis 74030]|uniref:PPM-type phosphatase domain-containing protein n=1 Tax=Glarea lozoyensis (strain ATCC 74030 / MF5533) TaxID=1104152 RepID=H0EG77_GLAL7|nr:putative protein phosphatase 2C like protein C10F6.17c [Glarea lozoyensis 74030]
MNSKASFAEKVLRLAPGFNGSCDSRAVLGYQTAEGKWETRPLSVDQNVKNAAEVERVRCEHPNEENLIRESYYMGYEPTRVFGDGKSKWPLELSNEAKERFNAGHAQKPERYKTPPYHTARPEVVTTQLEKGRPAFMILASDGVWDTMSSEQGVALVGRWVDWVKAGKPAQKEVSEFGEFDLKEEGALDFKEAKTTVQDEN